MPQAYVIARGRLFRAREDVEVERGIRWTASVAEVRIWVSQQAAEVEAQRCALEGQPCDVMLVGVQALEHVRHFAPPEVRDEEGLPTANAR